MEVSAASSKKIQEVAKNEQMLLQAHEVKLPDPTGIAGIEDDTSVKILNVYHPLMFKSNQIFIILAVLRRSV